MAYAFNPFTGTLDDIGSGSSAGGSTTQVQFNDSGSFNGDADFTYDKTSNALTVGSVVITSSTVPANGIYLPSSNNFGISTNGTQRFKVDSNGYTVGNVSTLGSGIYLPYQYYRLDSSVSGANVNTVQSALGAGVTLAGSTIYEFEAVYIMQKTAGTTSHSIGYSFGGTATLNNIAYHNIVTSSGTSGTSSAAASTFSNFSTVATNVDVGLTTTTANVTRITRMRGTVSVNSSGTFIPQYTLSAAPGGAYTTVSGSYFKISPLGAAGANTSIGTWA